MRGKQEVASSILAGSSIGYNIFSNKKKGIEVSAKEKIVNFIKKETVLSVAIVFAIITCFFVPIDKRIYRIF